MNFGWAGTDGKRNVLRRQIALRQGLREMQKKHGLQPSPKHVLLTNDHSRPQYLQRWGGPKDT